MPKRSVTTTRAALGSTSRSSLIKMVWLKELTWSSTCWRNPVSAIRWAPAQDKLYHNPHHKHQLMFAWLTICVCVFLKAPNERNYHIFYCLLSGMPKGQKKVLSLDDVTQFTYLTEVWTSDILHMIWLWINKPRHACSYDTLQ